MKTIQCDLLFGGPYHKKKYPVPPSDLPFVNVLGCEPLKYCSDVPPEQTVRYSAEVYMRHRFTVSTDGTEKNTEQVIFYAHSSLSSGEAILMFWRYLLAKARIG